VVNRLLEVDPRLWLSRSWTTRARRQGEPEDAYVFVPREAFEQKVADGGFLEWNQFLGELYGTPVPEPPEGKDLVFEIDVNGADAVLSIAPDALVVLIVAPSPDIQAARLTGRGDSPERVAERLTVGAEEERRGRELADHVVVNDDLDRAVAEVASILEAHRSTHPA
jgi:guanylate kinase